jgi:transposase-like protein
MAVEVLSGPERRRRWSSEEKAAIVAEAILPGARVSEIARRHGISRGLLYTWRRDAGHATGTDGSALTAAGGDRRRCGSAEAASGAC